MIFKLFLALTHQDWMVAQVLIEWKDRLQKVGNSCVLLCYNFLYIILMMQSLLACFACGDKNNQGVIAPENVNANQIKVAKLNESQIKTDDNKSRISMTTVTFLTSETAPTKDEDDDQQIRRRIQILRKKDLPERKAMESQFVRQNLVRSNVIYLIDKKWSEEYTKFLKNLKITTMPEIDNERLMDLKGELKLNLKEKEDYFIVTQKIWKFVHGLYGGGPAIARDSTFPVFTLGVKRITLTPIGMQNPLNLCFIISIMQMLMSIEQINGYMHKRLYVESSSQSKKKNVHNSFNKLLKQYSDAQSSSNDSKAIQIKQFASLFQNRFDPKQQHDAHQFLLNFMEFLQEQMKIDISALPKPTNNPESLYSFYFKQHKSIIDKVFAGQQETIVTCLSCQNKSLTFVPFLELVISIIGFSTIQECLDNYFESEKLKDLYDCQNCKKKTKAVKSTFVTKTPNYLIIVLGKFSSTTSKKIEDRVQYDFDLSLKKHCFGHCGDTNYSLQSLIIHKGTKVNKGHYYTIARRGSKNEWFYFNDANVKQIDEKQVLGRDPYILVYERSRSA